MGIGRPKGSYIISPDGTKHCSRCNQTKPLTEFYHKNYNGVKRPYSRCKRCLHEISNEWQKANREKVNAYNAKYKERPGVKERVQDYQRQWSADNRDKVAAKAKRYRERHPERVKEIKKANREKNSDAIKARKQAHRAANIDRIKAYEKHYRDTHPEKVRRDAAKRRASKKRATAGWADLDAIAVIYDKAIRYSAILGRSFRVDHVVPLNSKYVCGLHVETNLQLLDDPLNATKGNREWPDMPDLNDQALKALANNFYAQIN